MFYPYTYVVVFALRQFHFHLIFIQFFNDVHNASPADPPDLPPTPLLTSGTDGADNLVKFVRHLVCCCYYCFSTFNNFRGTFDGVCCNFTPSINIKSQIYIPYIVNILFIFALSSMCFTCNSGVRASLLKNTNKLENFLFFLVFFVIFTFLLVHCRGVISEANLTQ